MSAAEHSHCAVTDAALRIGDQRAISAFTKASNFAGVRSSLAGTAPPRSARRFCNRGIVERLVERARELLDDLPGNALGGEDPGPDAHLVVDAELLGGRHVGQRGETLRDDTA